MLDATLETFETEVIAASMHIPVLLDFWAPWCGPCKTLGPLLETLEAAYDARFQLVKVDVEQQQQLAAMFGIRSIPTCILLLEGRPVDGFTGVLPEGQLRAFLDKHLPAVEHISAQSDVSEAQQLLQAGDSAGALQKLAQALEADPDNDDARYDYARLLITQGHCARADELLAGPLKRITRDARFEALHQWLQCQRLVLQSEIDLEQLDTHIAQQPRDFAARFCKAQALAAHERWAEGMDALLEIILRDKEWNAQAARKLYIAILDLMMPPRRAAQNADKSADTSAGLQLPAAASAAPQDETTQLCNSYRRKLSMALN